jgi:hypothetical protein
MRAIVQSDPPTAYASSRLGMAFPADVRAVCLWSAFGLALTGLFFALGFGAEIGQALAAVG